MTKRLFIPLITYLVLNCSISTSSKVINNEKRSEASYEIVNDIITKKYQNHHSFNFSSANGNIPITYNVKQEGNSIIYTAKINNSEDCKVKNKITTSSIECSFEGECFKKSFEGMCETALKNICNRVNERFLEDIVQ